MVEHHFLILDPSPLNAPNPEPTPSAYHPPVESASPSSAGKMMPSTGKGGKPTNMSALARTSMPQQMTNTQHPVYYNGGKGNPSSANAYPMMMGHPSQITQSWPGQSQPTVPVQQQAPQQAPPHRYPTHMSAAPGKPMAYNQQRMAYSGDPYMMRQATPSGPPSSYPYPSNMGKLSKVYANSTPACVVLFRRCTCL
jgi:hypothetical protein